jgi:hypothetical protein
VDDGAGTAPQPAATPPDLPGAGASAPPAPPPAPFAIPAPVDGVSTTDGNSVQLAAWLDGGAPQFAPGTEAVALVDGTFSVGPDTDEAFIQRLYVGLLGRGGDAAGIGFFDAQLRQGASPAQVAAGVLGSAEYTALHGAAATQDAAPFVAGLYQGLLGRAPTAGDLASWTAALDAGQPREAVAAAIAGSAEAKAALAASTAAVWSPDPDGALVHQLYQAGLGREVEAGSTGAAFWSGTLQGGATPQQVADGIAGSAEFAADHAGQDAAAFVASLYQDGLGRAPDQAGLQFWAGGLQAGSLTPGEVLLGIGGSAEAAAHLTRTP